MHPGFLSYGTLTQRELPLHRNRGLEMVYLEEGYLRWAVEGREEAVSAGSVFFTLPWQAHGSRYAHEPGNRIHFVLCRMDRPYRRPVRTFRFHPSLGVDDDEARRASRILSGATRHAWPASAELTWLLRALVAQLEAGGDPLLVRGLFLGTVAELAAVVAGRRHASIRRSPTERRVQAFLARLPAHCEDAWQLPRMAEACGLGISQLSTLVKRLTGDSPMVHLTRARVTKAEGLLRRTDRSVTDIAFDCGFSSSQLFARTFRAYTNRTPTGFRRACRERSRPPVLEWTEEDERRRFEAVRRRKWI
jgi:AraC family L-rhamnose operon regulatory protein RhaS